MNVKFVLLVIVSLHIVAAAPLYALGPQNVAHSVHNLSSTIVDDPTTPPVGDDQYVSGNEDEICIFCHTPHGGVANSPLWNRDVSSLAAKTFTHYTSATVHGNLKGANVNRAVSDESLMCLSCHDGVTSPSSVINASNDIGLPEFFGGTTNPIPYLFGGPGTLIGFKPDDADPTTIDANPATWGVSLGDDHPISFDYATVQGAKTTKFWDVLTVTGNGVRLFNNAAGTTAVECSSCHDPHVDYWNNPGYTPFLVVNNTGSFLCLSCHKK